MNETGGSVTWNLDVDETGLKRGLSQAANDVRSTAESVESSVGKKLQTLGSSLYTTGRELTRGVTLPVVALGTAIFKTSADFEESLNKIVGLVGISRSQVNAWKGDFEALAVQTGKTPDDLAKAMFFITSAGLRGQAALDALTASAKASAAGLGDTAVVADAVTSAINSYAKSGLSASRATDILAAAVKAGKVDASTIAPVLGNILPIAASLKVRFEDVAGAMASMTRVGLDAATAGTSIRGVLSSLIKPGQQAKDALSSVGLNFQDLRDILAKPGGIIQVMRLLNERFGDNEEAMAAVIPDVRAFRGVMAVLAQDSSSVDTVMGQVANSVGLTNTAFEAASEGPGFKFHQTMAQIQDTLIRLGDTLAPLIGNYLAKLGDIISKLADFWSNLNPHIKTTVGYVAGFTAVLGPVLLSVGALTRLFGTMIVTLGGLSRALGISQLAMATFGRTAATAAVETEGMSAASGEAGMAGVLGSKGGLIGLIVQGASKLGPYGLAIAGVTAATIGVVAWLKHHHDSQADLSKSVEESDKHLNKSVDQSIHPYSHAIDDATKKVQTLGTTLTDTSTGITIHQLAVNTVKNATDDLNSSNQKYIDLQKLVKPADDAVVAAKLAVKKAQDDYNSAVSQFGPNSAQAQAASDLLSGAQGVLNQKLIDAFTASTNANTAFGFLTQAQKDLHVANDGLQVPLSNTAGGIQLIADKAINAYNKIISLHGSLNDLKGTGGINIPVNIQVQTGTKGTTLQNANFNFAGSSFNIQGTRAAGGPVMSNSSYLVGENGPEIFTPSSAGTITPNDKLNKSPTINQYNSIFNQVDLDQVTRDLAWRLQVR